MVEILLVITQDKGWVFRNEFVVMAFAISYYPRYVFIPALHRESTNSLIEHLLLCVLVRYLTHSVLFLVHVLM